MKLTGTVKRPHLDRFARIVLGLCMVVLLCGAPVREAHAKSEAELLRARYTTLLGQIRTLSQEIMQFRSSLLTQYACPPATPNKSGPQRQLSGFSSRVTALSGSARSINNRRTVLGRAGEGQVGRGFFSGKSLAVTDTEMTAANRGVAALRRDLAAARQDLNSRPKTERDCNPRADPVRSINFNAGSRRPGSQVVANVSATTAGGKAVNITALNVGGIGPIGTLIRVGGVPGANPTVTFKIADVRRHGPFNITVSVTGTPVGGPPGSPATSQSRSFSYTVANATPQIVSTPTAAPVDPGEQLDYSGAVTIIDLNADNHNAGEVRGTGVTLTGHPADLDTVPGGAFNRLTRVQFGSHDASTGTYVFNVQRKANVKHPHKHGIFKTKLKVTDRKSATAETDVDLKVKNKPPEGALRVRPKRGYHAGDGIAVVLSGWVKDANGRTDIEEIEIDATAAGGDKYLKSNGKLALTDRGDDGFSFTTIAPTFAHTNDRGEHAIGAVVRDDGAPEQGEAATETKFPSSITVGNDPPTMNAYGYLYGNEFSQEKRLCPGQLFKAGTNARDNERDTLTVTATIMPGGTPVVMTIKPGETIYTAHMVAPQAPGKYTLVFRAVESGTKKPEQFVRSVPLIVDPCRPTTGGGSGVAMTGGAGAAGGAIAVTAGSGSLVKVVRDAPALPGDAVAEEPAITAVANLYGWSKYFDYLEDEVQQPFNWEEISPRIGLTYDVFSDGSTLFKPTARGYNENLNGNNHVGQTNGFGVGHTNGFGSGFQLRLDYDLDDALHTPQPTHLVEDASTWCNFGLGLGPELSGLELNTQSSTWTDPQQSTPRPWYESTYDWERLFSRPRALDTLALPPGVVLEPKTPTVDETPSYDFGIDYKLGDRYSGLQFKYDYKQTPLTRLDDTWNTTLWRTKPLLLMPGSGDFMDEEDWYDYLDQFSEITDQMDDDEYEDWLDYMTFGDAPLRIKVDFRFPEPACNCSDQQAVVRTARSNLITAERDLRRADQNLRIANSAAEEAQDRLDRATAGLRIAYGRDDKARWQGRKTRAETDKGNAETTQTTAQNRRNAAQTAVDGARETLKNAESNLAACLKDCPGGKGAGAGAMTDPGPASSQRSNSLSELLFSDETDEQWRARLKGAGTRTQGERFEDWLDDTFGFAGPAPNAQEIDPGKAQKLERKQLRARRGILDRRQQGYGWLQRNLEGQLKRATKGDDPVSVTHLNRLIAEVTATQSVINAETKAVNKELAAIDGPAVAARDQLRYSLADQVNAMARDQIERRLDTGASPGGKKGAKPVARWMSTGSAMSVQTNRTARLADRELAAAEAKIRALDSLLNQVEPGSSAEKILLGRRLRLAIQLTGAEQMLDTDSKLTAAGYGTDVALTVTSAKFIQLGRKSIADTASRILTPQLTGQPAASTTAHGVIELSKSPVDRAGAGQTAAGRPGSVAPREAPTRQPRATGQTLSDDAIREGHRLVEQLAREKYNGNYYAALSEFLDGILYRDLRNGTNPASHAARQELNDAIRAAKDAARKTAARRGVQSAALRPLEKSTVVWGLVPYLFAESVLQQGHDADPIQGKADASGNLSLNLPAGIKGVAPKGIRLTGAKAQDGIVVVAKPEDLDEETRKFAGTPFAISGTWYTPLLVPDDQAKKIHDQLHHAQDDGWKLPSLVSRAHATAYPLNFDSPGHLKYQIDPCFQKKFVPLNDWKQMPPGAPPPEPLASARLSL